MDLTASFRIPEELKNRLEKAARESGYSTGDYIRLCIEEKLNDKTLVKVLVRNPRPLVVFLKTLGEEFQKEGRSK